MNEVLWVIGSQELAGVLYFEQARCAFFVVSRSINQRRQPSWSDRNRARALILLQRSLGPSRCTLPDALAVSLCLFTEPFSGYITYIADASPYVSLDTT